VMDHFQNGDSDKVVSFYCHCRESCNSTSTSLKHAAKTAANPEQTSSLSPCFIPVNLDSERQRILATNPTEPLSISHSLDQNSNQQPLFSACVKHKLAQNEERHPYRWVSEGQPINPKRKWHALAQKLVGFAYAGSNLKGCSYHCGGKGTSKGHYGGGDNLILQGNRDKINSCKGHTAEKYCEEGAHKHFLSKGGSSNAKTETSCCKVQEQQPTIGLWEVMNLEQLATAYLDFEDGQHESEVVSDEWEHLYSTRTLNHAQSRHASTRWDGKRHSDILAESEGHKRYKKSAQCWVSRESGSEQSCGALLCEDELLQQSAVTSIFCTSSSKFDFVCIDSKATSEEDSWGRVVCSEELNENEPKESTLQDSLRTGSTFLLQRANFKAGIVGGKRPQMITPARQANTDAGNASALGSCTVGPDKEGIRAE